MAPRAKSHLLTLFEDEEAHSEEHLPGSNKVLSHLRRLAALPLCPDINPEPKQSCSLQMMQLWCKQHLSDLVEVFKRFSAFAKSHWLQSSLDALKTCSRKSEASQPVSQQREQLVLQTILNAWPKKWIWSPYWWLNCHPGHWDTLIGTLDLLQIPLLVVMIQHLEETGHSWVWCWLCGRPSLGRLTWSLCFVVVFFFFKFYSLK